MKSKKRNFLRNPKKFPKKKNTFLDAARESSHRPCSCHPFHRPEPEPFPDRGPSDSRVTKTTQSSKKNIILADEEKIFDFDQAKQKLKQKINEPIM